MEQPKSPMAGAQEGWTGHETGGVERAHCCSTSIMMMTTTTRCGSSNGVAAATSQKEMVQEGVAHRWCWCVCVGHAGGASHQCLWRPSHCRPTHSASSTPCPNPNLPIIPLTPPLQCYSTTSTDEIAGEKQPGQWDAMWLTDTRKVPGGRHTTGTAFSFRFQHVIQLFSIKFL